MIRLRSTTALAAGVLYAVIAISAANAADVVISEFMAVNTRFPTNELGKCDDWIEVHNNNPTPQNMSGWYLTDDDNNLTKWQFPSTNIAALSHILVWASAHSNSVVNGELHCNFSLTGNGEYLALVRPDGTNVEHQYYPEFPEQTADVSFGLRPGTTNHIFVSTNAPCKFTTPADGNMGTNWILPGFNDSGWSSGTSGLGYETNTANFGTFINTEVDMCSTGVYARFAFTVPPSMALVTLTMRTMYDDGFVAYIDGRQVARKNNPEPPLWDSLSLVEQPNDDAALFESFKLDDHLDLLTEGNHTLAIHMINYDAHPGGSDLLMVPELTAEQLSAGMGDEWRFFHEPTPLSNNVMGVQDYMDPVAFSHDHGFYDEPFDLYLSNNVEGATIKYTLDFSMPDSTNGTVYTNAIVIDPTVIVRARAFKDNYESSAMVTHSYIAMADAINQPTNPPGFPLGLKWGSPYANYGMNQDVVEMYREDLTNAFLSMPTVSMTLEMEDVFGATGGMYTHPTGTGPAWERPCSLEWINEDGTKGFNVNCGVRVYGGYSRTGMRKKSMRLLFKKAYGPGTLKYKMFDEDSAATEFNSILLGGKGCVDIFGGVWNVSPQYAKNQYPRILQVQTGNVGGYSTFAHLFINGLYWGMYSPMERTDASFAASYYGGEKEDWDVNNAGAITGEGSIQSFQDMHGYCADNGLTNNVHYQRIQGNNPDGTRNLSYDIMLDVDNLLDYLMVNYFVGNTDWPHHNYYAGCGRGEYRTGFKYFIWDPEACLNSLVANTLGRGGGAAYPWSHYMRYNPEARLRFADRVHIQMFNDGPMTADAAATTYDELTRKLALAVKAEACRWGATTGRNSWDNWTTGRDHLVESLLPLRTAVVLDQFRSVGWYPRVEAPEFNQHGGSFTSGFHVAMFATNTIYYTLDNTDPREYLTGNILGVAYTNPIELTDTTYIMARSYGSVLGTNTWSALCQAWFTPSSAEDIRISEIMYAPYAPSEVSTNRTRDFEYIELWNAGASAIEMHRVKFTAGIDFEFTNGIVMQPGDFAVLAANLDAFSNRYDTSSVDMLFDFGGSLDNGGEEIVLKSISGGQVIARFEYGDGREWPLAADGAGHSLVPATWNSQSNHLLTCGDNWRRSTYINGSPGETDPAPIWDVCLNEIVAHSDYTNDTPPWNQYDSDDWIELYNNSGSGVVLSNWFLSDDIDDLRQWEIPPTNVIGALSWLTFNEVHDFHFPITNGFGLNKDGEQVFLSYLPSNGFDRVADCVRFKGQENEASLGRYGDGQDYWYPLVPTTNTANASPTDHIVINEIMYNPLRPIGEPDDNLDDEYIELYNPMAQTVDLWNGAGRWRINGGIEYHFPTNTKFFGKEYILIVPFDPSRPDKLDEFREAYGTTNSGVRFFGPYSGRLSNRGERLALERPQAPDVPGGGLSWVIVDEVFYYDQEPWGPEADGSGKPLQRLGVTASGHNPANWTDVFAASPENPQAMIGITSPQNSTSFIIPFTANVVATVDSQQIDDPLQHVEFFLGTNSLGTYTNAPFEHMLTTTTNEGTHDLSAKVVDNGGTNESAWISIHAMSLANGTADQITDVSARLWASASGDGSAWLTIYWGPEDGGTNRNAWYKGEMLGVSAAGSLSANIEGIVPSKTYYYRCHGENSANSGWASETASFTTLSIGSWSNRAMISFDGYDRAEVLNDFPALVVLGTNIPGFSYNDFAYTNGTDLRFTDFAMEPLPFEIDTWNPSGDSYVWVLLPTMSSGGDFIYAYWGNSNATVRPAYTRDGSTWPISYEYVWHLNPNASDSTVNQVIGFDWGSSDASGIAGRSRSLDGIDDYIWPKLYKENYGSIMDSMTVSFWAYPEAAGDEARCAFGSYTNDVGRNMRRFHIMQATNRWETWIYKRDGTNSDHAVSLNDWQMLTLVMESGSARLYKDAVPSDPITYESYDPHYSPAIGYAHGYEGTSLFFEGRIDEMRMSNQARSGNWVWACYMNMRSNFTFATYGAAGPNVVLADADVDGMIDEWEIRCFGGLSEPGCEGADDIDGDGAPNLWEYIAGTDPTNEMDYLCLDVWRTNGSVALAYRTIAAQGTEYPGVIRYYHLQDTTNLIDDNWLLIPGWTNVTGDGNRVAYTNMPANSRYFRVKAELR